MAQPAYITTLNKTNTSGSGSSNQVYISPAHEVRIPEDPSNPGGTGYNINYFSVYDPATKETNYYQTETNAFGQNRYVDANGNYTTTATGEGTVPAISESNLLGTRSATGEYTANENYKTNTLSGENIQNSFTNAESVHQQLEATTEYTVKDAIKQNNGGTPATATQLEAALPSKKAEEQNPDNPDPNAPSGPNPSPSTGDDDGDETVVGSLSAFDSIDTTAAAFSSKSGKQDLIYPERSSLESTDYLKFTSLEYAPATFNETGFSFNYDPQSANTATADGTKVYLPIQGTISDSNGVGWNEETINAAQIVGAQIADATMRNGVGAGLGEVSKVLQKAKGANAAVREGIIAAMTESAIGANILPRVSRAIFNPNTELLFQGPQLRAFTFTFKLTPRSDGEAKTVKDIIKFFKKNMAAKTSTEELFLKAPNVFRIEYLHRNKTHDGINLIKDCALQSFNVDYTPDGSYMAYEDGSMFSYNLTLQFMELVPIYSKDYDSGSGSSHSIGY